MADMTRHRNPPDRLDRHRPHGLRDGGSASPRPAPTSPCGTARARRRSRSPQHGAKIADPLADLAAATSCSHGLDLGRREGGHAGAEGLLSGGAGAEAASSNARRSRSKARPNLRTLLANARLELLAAPVSGNAKVIKAGRLSFVCSGPKAAFDARCRPEMIAPSGELRRRRRARAHRQDLPQRASSAS